MQIQFQNKWDVYATKSDFNEFNSQCAYLCIFIGFMHVFLSYLYSCIDWTNCRSNSHLPNRAKAKLLASISCQSSTKKNMSVKSKQTVLHSKIQRRDCVWLILSFSHCNGIYFRTHDEYVFHNVCISCCLLLLFYFIFYI